MKIELKPELERLELQLQAEEDVSVILQDAENSILFEIAPALSVKAADTIDYTMYYNLSKG